MSVSTTLRIGTGIRSLYPSHHRFKGRFAIRREDHGTSRYNSLPKQLYTVLEDLASSSLLRQPSSLFDLRLTCGTIIVGRGRTAVRSFQSPRCGGERSQHFRSVQTRIFPGMSILAARLFRQAQTWCQRRSSCPLRGSSERESDSRRPVGSLHCSGMDIVQGFSPLTQEDVQDIWQRIIMCL